MTLTDLGSQTMARMAADREQAAAQLLSDLSDSQLDQLRQALDTVAGRLHRLVEAAASSRRQRHDPHRSRRLVRISAPHGAELLTSRRER